MKNGENKKAEGLDQCPDTGARRPFGFVSFVLFDLCVCVCV